IWACATSAYQVEGGHTADGKGASIWDVICEQKGRIADGTNGNITCDSFHRYKEDIECLKKLGVTHYRFSISWPRVLPRGTIDEINEQGLQYYENLINRLISEHIEPIVTLFHWDFPLALTEHGGWLNPLSIKWFSDYAQLCFSRFDKNVKLWITFNEICMHAWCSSFVMPGLPDHRVISSLNVDESSPYVAGHHMLLAHATAYRIYEEHFKNIQKGRIGIVFSGQWYEPLNDGEEAAARNARMWTIDWLLHPILKEDYPCTMKQRLAEVSKQTTSGTSLLPEFTKEEIQLVKGSADFIGLNYYTAALCRKPNAELPTTPPMGILSKHAVFENCDDPRWERICGENCWIRNTPFGLRKMLRFMRDEYDDPPLLITENGCADAVGEEALVDDARIRYCNDHIRTVELAIKEDKANVFGYTLWSLLDNFEWNSGYTLRFGLFHVDFNDAGRKRTPKKSVAWYYDLIQRQQRAAKDISNEYLHSL
uniref:Beta-glucosidase n=1 Tax=Parascaris univalens TaxID=6257 RepID=A0A915BS37_PARUN